MSSKRHGDLPALTTLEAAMPIQNNSLDSDYDRPIRFGMWLLILGFGGFMTWAAIAPLDEAVPAQGVVSVESNHKRVDHLTGGIIEKILVHDGDRVQEGQDLLVFNAVQVRAALNSTLNQWRIAIATEARLMAERAGLNAVAYPADLAEHVSETEVMTLLQAQNELFHSRRSALRGELAIIRESVRGLELQLASFDQLKTGREKHVQLSTEQLASFSKLKQAGFVSRNQLLEIERQLADVQSKQSEDLANIAGVNTRLAEYRMRAAQREMEYRRDVEAQLADVQKEAGTLSERLAALRDTHDRLALRAPATGIVVDMAFHTVGSTIKPGDRILDIVPEGDELIVEAQVAPQYIDRLYLGQEADVHFDAYMVRTGRSVVRGKILLVSADALTDQRTGLSYYTISVSVPAAELKNLSPLRLQPGMQAIVMVKTGERSLLAYLTTPFLRRFIQGMRER